MAQDVTTKGAVEREDGHGGEQDGCSHKFSIHSSVEGGNGNLEEVVLGRIIGSISWVWMGDDRRWWRTVVLKNWREE